MSRYGVQEQTRLVGPWWNRKRLVELHVIDTERSCESLCVCSSRSDAVDIRNALNAIDEARQAEEKQA